MIKPSSDCDQKSLYNNYELLNIILLLFIITNWFHLDDT